MTALTLDFPEGRGVTARTGHSPALAYLSGVLAGDGWCGTSVGLRAADHDFTLAFSAAINEAFGMRLPVRRDERGYWLVRTGRTAPFIGLRERLCSTRDERGAWLRGFFDSEGNANLVQATHCARGFGRRVSFYSTNSATLTRAVGYLDSLGIPTLCRVVKPSAGHLGPKTVYELSIRGSLLHYEHFTTLVGSNIARKARRLEAIVGSYEGLADRLRAAQLAGAAIRHRRTMEQTLPRVVEGVRALIVEGIKPTQRNCRCISGYHSIQRHVPQAELVAMAQERP